MKFRRRLEPRRQEAAQMLLLTAVILAIGFIALSSLSSRVNQIPEQARLVQDDPFFDELDLVTTGTLTTMDTLAADVDLLFDANFDAALDGALAHLEQVERGRGFFISVGDAVCTQVGLDARISVDITLATTEQAATLTATNLYISGVCV